VQVNNQWKWMLWIIAAAFYFYEFVLQMSSGVLVEPLSKEFILNATAIGFMGAIYFYSYALMQLPAGYLLDQFGLQKILSCAAGFCALGSFILYLSPNYYWILFARFITAIGSAFAFLGALKAAEHSFSSERFAFVSGLTFTIGMLGAIFAKVPLAFFIDRFGWRTVMLFAALIGLGLAALIFLVFKKVGRIDDASSEMTNQEQIHLKDFISVFKNSNNWKAAFFGGLMISPMLTLVGLWGEKYLMDVNSYTHVKAAGIISLLFVGFAIGSPLAGWLSDKTKSRTLSMFISALGSLICFIFTFYLNLPDLQIFMMFFLGFFTGFSITVFALVKDSNPEEISATAMGFANLMNMIIGAISQTLVEIFLDYLWTGGKEGAVRIYSLDNYRMAFLTLLLSIISALILVFFIDEPVKSTSDSPLQ
jgi:MFS family permease